MPRVSSQTSRVAPDGGWGWFVVLGSFILQALTIGITYTFGIIFVDLLDYFGSSESETAWIGSIQPALLYFTGIVAGPLIKRFGWRSVTIFGSVLSSIGFGTSALAPNIYVLYFTYGVLTGIGMGLMYLTSMVAVQHYFEKRRAMATGLAVSGSGVGTLVFGFATRALLDKIGWRYTLVTQAGIILIGIFCGVLFRPLPEEYIKDDDEYEEDEVEETSRLTVDNRVSYGSHGKEDDDDSIRIEESTSDGCCNSSCGSTMKETFDFSIFKELRFTLFCVAIIMFCFGYHVPYTYTPERASKVYGIDTNRASMLVSVMGISNVASRLAFGWLGDRSPNIRFYLGGTVLTLGGIVSILIFLFNTYTTMIIYSVLFGAFTGCWASLFPVILVDLLGMERIERSIGLALASGSIAFLLASPMSGLIIDKTGSFDAPFMVVGSAQAVGGLIYFSILCTKKRSVEEVRPLRKRYVSESFS